MKKNLTINTDPISRMVNEYRAFFAQNTFETYMDNGKEIMDMLWIPNDEMKHKEIWFTADTHFGSERTLQLSKRDRLFKNDVKYMNANILQGFHNAAEKSHSHGKEAILFHLGDIGELDYCMKQIKIWYDKIYLITGNYEESPEFSLSDDELKEYGITSIFHEKTLVHFGGELLALAHKPTDCKELIENTTGCKYGLFGHIHGRQMVKPFGIDVGVDAQHFAPINLEDVKFFLNAIEKGYYDQDVWCQ